jgi:type III secretory pathway lipoprotein EscJ
MSVVVVAVIPNEAEADMILGLLRANGIEASHRGSTMTQSVWPMGGTSPIEVVVDESNAARAQELLDSEADPAPE